MKQSECPEGTVITLGHPANKILAVKKADGDWRLVESGKIADPEDFRGGWDIFVPQQPTAAAASTSEKGDA